jgi:predicted glycosyltransferase
MIAGLRAQAPASVQIEAARPDFRQMLTHAAASVSLCGYNTALDILQAGTPAVFVPFDDGGEVEQSLRARALQRRAGIMAITRAALTVPGLVSALEQVIAAPRRSHTAVEFDGADRTVTLTRMLRENR